METDKMAESDAPAAAPDKPAKERKSSTRTLTSGANKNQLKFIANVQKDGKVQSYVVFREQDENGKLVKSSRGATVLHDDLAGATAAIDAGVKAAVKKGWQEKAPRVGGGGFKPRPDAFSITNLPGPGK